MAGRRVVDIASPRRRYGRLAAFAEPGDEPTGSAERILKLFAQHAASVLDVFTVLSDAITG